MFIFCSSFFIKENKVDNRIDLKGKKKRKCGVLTILTEKLEINIKDMDIREGQLSVCLNLPIFLIFRERMDINRVATMFLMINIKVFVKKKRPIFALSFSN